MTKGILLVFWGKRGYGFAAHNLALSIKKYSNLPIHVLATEGVLKYIPLTQFDKIEIIDEPTDPGRFKVSLYDRIPFDHTLFLDVDALCLRDIGPTLDSFINDDKPYRCFVYGYYNKDSENEMPLMIWAYKDDIWNHYGLSDHTLPASQSSLQYIRKSEFCEKLFNQIQENFDNPIPLDSLRNKWGGTQPDELYLNVALAQLNYDPQCESVIYFGNDNLYNYHELKEKFDFLSLFGGRGMIKEKYLKSYDREVTLMGSKFKSGDIIPYKHANAKSRNTERQPITTAKGNITLFTSYFDASPARQKELETALLNNLNNPLINQVVLVGEKGYNHPKCAHIELERPTYSDFFRISNDYKGYKILANSDIYFDYSLSKVFSVGFHKTLLAISRHDVINDRKILFDASGWGRKGYSQDAWIWKDEIDIKGGDYFLGIPGCDNRLAHEAKESGYRLNNPARDLKIYHLHSSNERNYTERDRIDEPYLNVPITRIREVTKGKLLINQPGKVGDVLICLPIAKYYSYNYNVEWILPEQYHYLFDYVDYVKPIKRQLGKYDKVIDLSFGLSNSQINRWWLKVRDNYDSFVTAKYELAKVPLENFRKLEYARDTQKEDSLFKSVVGDLVEYCLVHDSSNDGTSINIGVDLPKVSFEQVGSYSIFDWRKVIEGAKEIHAIDSSLLNFVDGLDVDGKLFYHPAPRNSNEWNNTIKTKEWNEST